MKTRSSGTGKTNLLFNLVNQQQDIDKIYLYSKDPNEAKYKIWIKNVKMLKAFIEYSNDMDDIYKNIEKYNPNKKRKILIVFDDAIADILSNKELIPVVTELFIEDRKRNISLIFITQSCYSVSKLD